MDSRRGSSHSACPLQGGHRDRSVCAGGVGRRGTHMPRLQQGASCSLWRLSGNSGGPGMNWTVTLGGNTLWLPVTFQKQLATKALCLLPCGQSHHHQTTVKGGPTDTLLSGLCLKAFLCQEYPLLPSSLDSRLLLCPHPNLCPRAECRSPLGLPQIPGLSAQSPAHPEYQFSLLPDQGFPKAGLTSGVTAPRQGQEMTVE